MKPPVQIDSPSSGWRAGDWQLWQLIDSALPTGGFAHSTGLEAAWQHGLIGDGDSLLTYLRDLIHQTAVGSTPIAIAVCQETESFQHWDAFFDRSVSNHVANRASRAQGRALLATVAAVYALPPLTAAESLVRAKTETVPCHLPAVFGLTAATLGLDVELTAAGYLYLTARAAISAAVRLGAVGPIEGQRIQYGLSDVVETAVIVALATAPDDIYQTNFVADLLQGTQDRLYSRLFQS